MLEGEAFYFNFLSHFRGDPARFDQIYRRMLGIYLNPKSIENVSFKVNTWREVILKSVRHFRSDEEACLRCLKVFLEAIEGRLRKEGVGKNAKV